MKKLFSLVLVCISLGAQAQQKDPVVMRIAGVDVTRSEFEYSYNKNNTDAVIDHKAVEEYVDMYVGYRLKVQAALDMKMDTLSQYQQEFRMYRDQQIRPLLVTPQAREAEAHAYYAEMKKTLGGRKLCLPAHIFLSVAQNSTQAQQNLQKARIDSIYEALRQGADFARLAQELSQDAHSARNGGQLMWCGPGQLIPEFEKVMYTLKKGELSKPFLSSVGYHVILLKDVKELEPYDSLRTQILKYLDARGLEEHLGKRAVDSLSMAQGLTVEELMDRQADRLSEEDSDLKYLIKEYHDGLLMFEYCKTQIWDPATQDHKALARYFKRNRKKYAWDTPHFNGILCQTRNRADQKVIKQLLKKVPEQEWTKSLQHEMNKDSVRVRMEQRMFVRGEHALVDSLAFGIKDGKAQPRQDFPVTALYGRKLKKGPKRWTDVEELVKQDYQAQCERDVVEQLRKRYEVVVYPEVLKTVNKH